MQAVLLEQLSSASCYVTYGCVVCVCESIIVVSV